MFCTELPNCISLTVLPGPNFSEPAVTNPDAVNIVLIIDPSPDITSELSSFLILAGFVNGKFPGADDTAVPAVDSVVIDTGTAVVDCSHVAASPG
jgi:hypothetical protein